jgi:hypothetical protein
VQVTCTVGGVTGGNCAKPRLKTETPPASVITIDSTEAKIGRLMKNREITGSHSDLGRGL